MKNAALSKIRARLALFIEHNDNGWHGQNTCLDLSYARLGCLEPEQLNEVFLLIPSYVTHLKLTNNGFGREKQMLFNLGNALTKLPIVQLNEELHPTLHLDISDNELHTLEYAPIKQFLQSCPQNITISLSIDKPTNAYNHLCRLHWLNYYKTEAENHDNLLDFAHVLLNDYTMNNNFWLLIVAFKWGRNHFNPIMQDVQAIEGRLSEEMEELNSDTIKNSDDLLAKLNRYTESNPNGDFARRLAPLSLFSEAKSMRIVSTLASNADNDADIELSNSTNLM